MGDFKYFYFIYGDKVVFIVFILEKELIVFVYIKGFFLFDIYMGVY